MKLFERNGRKKTRGQTMVEFALVLPILLLVMFGIMELGRLLFIYVTTTSAAREATRYATAVEAETAGVPRYQDCDGIRAAAGRVDVLNAIQTVNVNYYTDYGGSGQISRGSCPVGGVGPNLNLGDQVVVEVVGRFDLIVDIVPININTITSESARTIIKDVPVGLLVPPIDPGTTGNVPPPWTFFDGTYGFIPENAANPNYYVPMRVTMQDGTDYDGDVEVTYRISGEATQGSDYIIHSGNPITITGPYDPEAIHIEVLDDDIYEYYERVIIFLETAVPGGVVWPSTYVLYIVDDDRIPPVIEFASDSSTESEAGSPSKNIYFTMDKLSQRDTYVPITVVTGSNPSVPDATLGLDYLPRGWNFSTQSSILTIPANTAPEDVDLYPLIVDIFDDSRLEGDEIVEFMLGTPLNATLGDQITHTLTILDNENTPHNCANYEISTMSSGLNNNQFGITLTNNDPAPVYIRALTARWRGGNVNQTWYLRQIHFGGALIWSGDIISPFISDWPSLALNRQIPSGSRNLVFTTSRNSPILEEVTVTLDNDCILSR
jgi:Flp pilus assembly protein TadG